MRYLNLIILVILSSLNGFSQPLSEYNHYKELYPNADVICSKLVLEIEINLENNKPVITYNNVEEFFYLTSNNSGYNERSLHFSGFYQLLKYSAYSLEVQGNKYKKNNVKDFKVNDFVNNNIFFDDSKELKFVFNKIGKGDKTYIENLYQINETHFLPKFSISPYLNYDQIQFVVKVNQNIEIAIDTFNWSKSNLKYQEVKKGNNTIYTWEGSSKKTLDYESDAPDIDYLSSQLHFRIKSYQAKEGKVSVLANLNDLYKWNCQFVEKSAEDFTQFKSLSDSIVGTEKDANKKASLIYDWVQNNIRYIAFEAGYEGHIPAKASLVCKERYGDCKGISNILYSLLKSQNLEAYLVWIGTRDLPYKYTQIPSSSVDNHMITAIKLNGQFVFLDGTANNLKFGLPSPFIQGKEALISLGSCNDYKIEVVPETPYNQNAMHDSCYLKIKGKDVIGQGVFTLTGYQRMAFVDGLMELNYKYLLNQSRNYLIKGSNRFILDTVWFTNFNDKNLPLLIHYKFSIPEFVLSVDDEQYINLNLDKISLYTKVEPQRNTPKEFRFQAEEFSIVCLELEKGVKASYLPNNKNLQLEGLGFSNNYSQVGNYIYRKSNIIKQPMLIYPDQFAVYNTWIDNIQKNYSEQLILKK